MVVGLITTTTKRGKGMALVTVARLREYLDKVPANAATTTTLTNILANVESIVTDALGFTFLDAGQDWDDVTASAKRVRSEVSKYLRLPAYQVGSIVSIYRLDGVTVSDVAIEADTYEETDEHFYVYRPNGWGGYRYSVTAKFGYGPPPGSVTELILELAANVWRQKDQGLFQTSSGVDTLNNSTGGGFIKYVGGLNADQRKIIATVRRKYIEGLH